MPNPVAIRRLGPTASFVLGVAVSGVISACTQDDLPPGEAFENLRLPVEALDGREVQLRHRLADLEDDGLEVLLDDLYVTGHLDPAAQPVTTGVLYTSGTSIGDQAELVVAQTQRRRMGHLASFPLGERVRLESIRYEDGAIILHVLEFDVDDPPCCPSTLRRRHLTLHGSEVREVGIPLE